MAISTFLHIKCALILLFDGGYTPEAAAELLFKGIDCVQGELCSNDYRIRFNKKLKEFIE